MRTMTARCAEQDSANSRRALRLSGRLGRVPVERTVGERDARGATLNGYPGAVDTLVGVHGGLDRVLDL